MGLDVAELQKNCCTDIKFSISTMTFLNIIHLPLERAEVNSQQEFEELQDIGIRRLAEELPQVIAKSCAPRTGWVRGSLAQI